MRLKIGDQQKILNLWNGNEKIIKLGDAVDSVPALDSNGAAAAIRDGFSAATKLQSGGAMRLHRLIIESWAWINVMISDHTTTFRRRFELAECEFVLYPHAKVANIVSNWRVAGLSRRVFYCIPFCFFFQHKRRVN